MANAPLLERPPNDGQLWIPPDALGPDFKIVYTLGRNDGRYLLRKRRTAIHMHISHIMGNGKVTPQGFANSEMPGDATLAELATFPAANSPWKKPTLLQSLPLNIIGAGSVAGGATGITEESSNTVAGDTNTMVWDDDHIALKVAVATWLIQNPLRWPMLDIRHQVCRSPYGPSAVLGGLGDHTMWGTCGTSRGGTNPWTLYCKSCPGWRRRGTQRNVQFPNGQITDIPWERGNFRDFFERVGAALAGGQPIQKPEPRRPNVPIVRADEPHPARVFLITPHGKWHIKDTPYVRVVNAIFENDYARIPKMSVAHLNEIPDYVPPASGPVQGLPAGSKIRLDATVL